MTRDPRLLVALGMTGAAALALEVIWSRALIPWVGGTAMAQVATVGVYMLGLFAGSSAASRYLERVQNPRTLFLKVEAAAAFVSLLMIWGIPLADPLFRALSQGPLLSGGLGASLRGLAGGSLIFPATFLMGFGFPMAIAAYQDRGAGASSAAWVYGVNTVGAAAGALVGGFILVPGLGIFRGSLAVVAVDLIVLFWAGGGRKRSSYPVSGSSLSESSDNSIHATRYSLHSSKLEEPAMLLAVFVGGFVALGLEVLLFRVLGLILGPTVRAFTVVVTTYVLGLGLGSLFAGRIIEKGPEASRAVFMTSWFLAALLVFLIHGGLNILPAAAVEKFVVQSPSLGFQLAIKALMAAIILLPLTASFGAAYAGAVGAARLGSAQRAGRLYAALTLGNVLGLLATAVWIMPGMGPEGGLLLLGGLAFLVPLPGLVGSGYGQRMTGGLVAAVVLACLAAPQWVGAWNWKQLVSGAYLYGPKNLAESGKFILFLKHTSESSISVIKDKETTFFSVDGKVDGSNLEGDMETQSMLGLLGPLLHPNPEKALVIGLGTGQTVAEILRFPLSKVDCAEISPVVKEILPFFRDINRGFWKDKRFHLIQADGRTVLRYGAGNYDIIVSEPSNVWVPGVAQLFTHEAFMEARDCLRRPHGIFCQWFHAYRLHPDGFKMVVRAFLDVFPHVTLWTTGMANHDVLMVGSLEPLNFSQNQLDERLAAVQVPNYRLPGTILDSASFLRTYIGSTQVLKETIGPGPMSRQDRPRLEYLAEQTLLQFHTDFFDKWVIDIGRSAAELMQGNLEPEFENILGERAEGNRVLRKLWLQGRGWTGFGSKKAQGAVKMLRRLDQKFPDDLEYQKILADFPFTLGEAMYRKDDVTNAEKYFLMALDLWPSHKKALKNLTIIAMRRANYGTAREFQQRYGAAHPGSMAKLLEADIFRAQRLLAQAIPLYQQVRQADPLSLHASGALASCFAQMGLINEAAIVFEEVLEMDPGNSYATAFLQQYEQNQ